MNQIDARGRVTTVIHYTYFSGLFGAWRIACMPNMTEFHRTDYHPNYDRTNDVRAVTCQSCKKTPVFYENQRTEPCHVSADESST